MKFNLIIEKYLIFENYSSSTIIHDDFAQECLESINSNLVIETRTLPKKNQSYFLVLFNHGF
jgi:hypothetical protein